LARVLIIAGDWGTFEELFNKALLVMLLLEEGKAVVSREAHVIMWTFSITR